MIGHLIRIDSVDASGSDYPLFLASADVPELCHLDGLQWEPNIARLPTLRYDFFGGDFNGQIAAPQMQFSVSIDGIEGFTNRAYASARVRFYRGEVGDPFYAFDLLFDGLITAEPDVREGIATLSAGVDDAWLDAPLLDTYAGTGGIEGGDDFTGTLKPLVLGNVRFADAVLLDPVDLVYQVSDGAVNGIVATYDRAASLGTSTGDYADLAALLAASIPPGGWGTCKAYGLVRLGAPPDGRVAFDVQGAGSYARKPGAIIAAIAELAGGTVDAANLTALDTECVYNLQIQLLAQTTARTVIQGIADSIGAVAGVTWTGTLFVQPVAIDSEPVDELNADGTSELAVGEVSQLSVAAPFWRLAINAEPSYVVYALGDVATGYNLRGAYEAAREYRLDDLVFATDGRSFAYINASASVGNAPPTAPATSDAYWTLVGSATGAYDALTGLPTQLADINGTEGTKLTGIAAGATVGAPSGTTVGGRAADDVASTIASGGGVDVDQVSTTSIIAESVTTKTYAFTAGSVNIASGSYSYAEVQSATITTTGEDVEIDGYFELIVNDNCKYKYRILRDGTQLIDLGPISVNTSDGPPAFFRYVDSPAAGTYEYTLEVACNDATDIDVLNRGLSAKEIKR